jgi:hypothetical protein
MEVPFSILLIPAGIFKVCSLRIRFHRSPDHTGLDTLDNITDTIKLKPRAERNLHRKRFSDLQRVTKGS